jgi:hypothetical protein
MEKCRKRDKVEIKKQVIREMKKNNLMSHQEKSRTKMFIKT